jgi:hypothetical protein
MTLAVEGIAVDVTWQTDFYRLRTSAALAPFDMVVPDVEGSPLSRGTILFRRDEIVTTPLEEASWEGTWAMDLVLPSDLDHMMDAWAVGDPLLSTYLVDLQADGVGTARRATMASGVPLTWDVADGVLRMQYSGGGTQSMALWGQAPGAEYGLLIDYRGDQGPVVSYRPAVKRDGSLSLAEADLVTDAGYYWRSTINDTVCSLDASGAQLESTCQRGFVLRADKTAAWASPSFVEPAPTETQLQHVYDWDLVDGDVVITWRWGRYPNTPCNPEVASPCRAFQERVWEPLTRVSDTLYVVESVLSQADLFSMVWDEADTRWEIDGEAVDLTARLDMYEPRIVGYSLQPLPTVP